MGCGVFGNRIEWVLDAIEWQLPLIQERGLQVYLNLFNADALRGIIITQNGFIKGISPDNVKKLFEMVRARLPAGPDGSIAYSARANAIKACIPE